MIGASIRDLVITGKGQTTSLKQGLIIYIRIRAIRILFCRGKFQIWGLVPALTLEPLCPSGWIWGKSRWPVNGQIRVGHLHRVECSTRAAGSLGGQDFPVLGREMMLASAEGTNECVPSAKGRRLFSRCDDGGDDHECQADHFPVRGDGSSAECCLPARRSGSCHL